MTSLLSAETGGAAEMFRWKIFKLGDFFWQYRIIGLETQLSDRCHGRRPLNRRSRLGPTLRAIENYSLLQAPLTIITYTAAALIWCWHRSWRACIITVAIFVVFFLPFIYTIHSTLCPHLYIPPPSLLPDGRGYVLLFRSYDLSRWFSLAVVVAHTIFYVLRASIARLKHARCIYTFISGLEHSGRRLSWLSSSIQPLRAGRNQ